MNATEKQEAQTAEQTTYIFNWWFEHSAPTGLLNSEHNGVTLAQHIAKNFKGYITPLILTQACQELGDIETGGKLQYHHVVEKIVEVERKKTAQEIEHEKQIIRNREGITKSPLVRAKEETARANAERDAKTKAAFDDVNGESFQRRQALAKIEFEQICNGYMSVHPSGKTNHGLSQERREGLRGIVVRHNKKNAQGEVVLMYDEMLRLAQEALRGFDREDSRMGQR